MEKPDPLDPCAVRPAWTRTPLDDDLERVRQWRDALRNRLRDLPGAKEIMAEIESEFCVEAWEKRALL